jgi:hypothetical protein
MGMHHNRVQMHSLVVVLPGRNLGTKKERNLFHSIVDIINIPFVEHCLSQ